MTQTKKNFIYNLFYQILSFIIPLISIPYVSRVLGAENIGIYSYTYSIVYYFMLLSLLGINNYGNRTIAKSRDDKSKLSKSFLSIYSIQIFSTIIMILLYLLYIIIFNVSYKNIAIIQIIYLVSVAFDINWFFFGLEKFKLTVIRNSFLKILSLILIFVFVKSQNDLWIYTLILSFSTLLSQLVLFSFLFKEVKLTKIEFKDIKKHIKPIIILFIPVIAVSVYQIMDKVMIGLMSEINEVGFYEQAEKIVNIPFAIITAFGVVMLPKMSNLAAKNDEKSMKNYIEKSINFVMFISFPMCLGLISISNSFIPLFLGDGFIKSIYLVYFLATIIIFKAFSNVIRTQYLIPKEYDKIYVGSVIFGAVINFIANIILIHYFQALGACIGTIIAEVCVMLYQVVSVRKILPIKKYLKNNLPYLIKALIMFIIVYPITYLNISSAFKILFQIILGLFIYAILNMKYILNLLNIKGIKK